MGISGSTFCVCPSRKWNLGSSRSLLVGLELWCACAALLWGRHQLPWAPGNVTAEQGMGLEGGDHQARAGEGSCQPQLGPRGPSGGRCPPEVAPGPAVEKRSSRGCQAPPSPECGWAAPSARSRCSHGIFSCQSCPQLCLQEERPRSARGFGMGLLQQLPVCRKGSGEEPDTKLGCSACLVRLGGSPESSPVSPGLFLGSRRWSSPCGSPQPAEHWNAWGHGLGEGTAAILGSCCGLAGREGVPPCCGDTGGSRSRESHPRGQPLGPRG